MNDTINRPCCEYEDLVESWCLIHDLLGGTRAMRRAGERWLPKEPKEEEDKYRARLNRSVLYSGYKDTLERLSSKPFSKPTTVSSKDELPITLIDFHKNVDHEGTSLTQFAAKAFKSAATYGLVHVLVDMPPLAPTGTAPVGANPYWTAIEAPNLIDWKYESTETGRELASIKFREYAVEALVDGKEQRVTYVYVYTKTTWEKWKCIEDKPDEKLAEGVNTLGEIPLKTAYFDKTGFMLADPPLEDLAWQNLAHWQSYSDQRNILRVARCPMLLGTGFEDGELKTIAIGPTQLLKSVNKDANLRFVEHSGSSIEAGRQDVKDIEERMEVLGLKPLVKTSAKSTATGKAIDESSASTEIMSWVQAIQELLNQCYALAAKWLKIELPADFAVDVYDDFGLGAGTIDTANALIKLWAAGGLEHETLLNELKRLGILSDSIDTHEEAMKVEQRGVLDAQRESTPA